MPVQTAVASSVHPALLPALAAIQTANLLAAQTCEYTQLLKAVDWFHEYSDCAVTYRSGAAQMRRLRELQPTVDPYFSIWNRHAPETFKVRPC